MSQWQFTRNCVIELNKLHNGIIASVEEMPPILKWELWEGELVTGENTITKKGMYIIEESKRRGIIT